MNRANPRATERVNSNGDFHEDRLRATHEATQPRALQEPGPPLSTACDLLDFLVSIGGTHTLSGQHNYIAAGNRYTERAREIAGRTPLVWGSDFSFMIDGHDPYRYFHCGPINASGYGGPDVHVLPDATAPGSRQRMVRTAVERHRAGHIITLMWHACFPTEGDTCAGQCIWTHERRPDAATWRELTTPGTALHAQWLEQVDRIAGYLGELREAGVPVLWRPYHEMNGVWFWWCNKSGPEGFARLWIQMHERFTQHHGLDNLVWVWNANAPRDRPGDEAYAYREFYPGGDYVDVLAADVYRNDYRQSHHDELLELAEGRPIALGEVGELPTPEILEQQPCWAWFMPWSPHIESWCNPPEAVRTLYASPRVLALEDI